MSKMVMRFKPWVLAACLGAAGLVLAGQAHADGLSDLKAALARLQGQTPLKAQVEAKTWDRRGEGKDFEESQGAVSASLEDSARGLTLSYSRDMLNRLETEERNKERDSKAKTPTLSALNEVNSSTLRPMLSAGGVLSRSLEKAVFKSEKPEAYSGRPARVLRFELTADRLSEKDRKYLKSYDGVLDIWIAEDGTPLASKSSIVIAARAFLVVNFETKSEDEWVYAVVGERLVALRKESRNSSAGMGEKGDSKTIKTLQVLP